jgi:hypothetical protein
MLINLANNNPSYFLDQWEVYMNQSHALDHGLFTSLAFLINPHVKCQEELVPSQRARSGINISFA